MLPKTLSDLPFVERFHSHPVLASTNDTARAMTEFPQTGIFVVQADRQTHGRGRTGAAFFSDSAGGLWVSIVAPVASIGQHFQHNRALSVALCDAIEAATGTQNVCFIKWPNDIFWGDKKICGILLENHPANASMLVLGFGCNIALQKEDFPKTLAETATSILMETGKRYSRSLILREVLRRYHSNCADDQARTHRTYSRRLYGLRRAVSADGHEGVYDGVEIDGRLRLTTGRELIYITSGHLRFISNRNDDFDGHQNRPGTGG